MYRQLFFLCIFCLNSSLFAQEIELYEQFNGRYDYTAIGNTLNQAENNLDNSFCSTLPFSEAALNLEPNQTIIKAFLYWAGSGLGDTTVTLNNTSIEAEITYNVDFTGTDLTYFSCFAEITTIVSTQGNGIYTLSDLDISETLNTNLGYCSNRTNFAGWSLYIIYQDDNLPLNQISLFQGLDIINATSQEKIIQLENLNVLDTDGAKIGFLAWEGDNALNYGESLSINNNILSNPPLNSPDNAFNGTNTFTNENTFYNADLDVYNIQDNIAIGDTSATIKLTTGDFDQDGDFRADLIILNNIITVLNSQLPDATISLNSFNTDCYSRLVDIYFTVFNTNSTEILPANTPIAFYIDTNLVATFETINPIAIGNQETYTIMLEIPDNLEDSITIVSVVDDQGDGTGIVPEINETNNTDTILIELTPLPETIALGVLNSCNQGFSMANFNLLEGISEIISEDINNYLFYESLEDLIQDTNTILNPETYTNTSNSQILYIKVENTICFDIYSLQLLVENCPPIIPQGFSPNEDGKNDWFNIQGLYNIFLDHELHIYNRYGVLIFKGNNDYKWFGETNKEFPNNSGIAPVGTYYYVLNLNDSSYQPIVGWVYLNR